MSQTLEQLLTDLTMMGADRCAIVRAAQMGKPQAVCVVMASKRALRELGKPLLKVATVLGNATADFGAPGISEKTTFVTLFEMADSAPNGWCWAAFKFFKLEVTLAIFCRSVEAVAKVCTERGAPCSLDPEKAAEGYEITKTLTRGT